MTKNNTESIAMLNRMERLKRNPHNINLPGCPAMTNMAYWKARFELQGATASNGAPNPYKYGTLAHESWQRGRDYVANLLELDCTI